MNEYVSKYPEIEIDRSNTSPNTAQYKLVQEEFYDLMHHTHKLSTLIMDNGGNVQEVINALVNDVNELKRVVKLQNEVIDKLIAHANLSAEIGDWDATTPGIQDQDGNTVSTLLGLDMIEIK